MPAFQAHAGIKRKSDAKDDTEHVRKKPSAAFSGAGLHNEEYWVALWRNPQYKKHKTWDGDAVLVSCNDNSTLFDTSGKIISTGKVELPLCEGKNMTIGSKEIELERPITKDEYLSGACFGFTSTIGSLETPAISHLKPCRFKSLTLLKPSSIQSSTARPDSHEALSEMSNRSSQASASLSVDKPIASQSATNPPTFWIAHWRKQNQTKKNKTWDGDGYVIHREGRLRLFSEEGKEMGSVDWKSGPLYDGLVLHMSGKVIELDALVDKSQLPGPLCSQYGHNPGTSAVFEQPIAEAAKLKASTFVTPSSFYSNASNPRPCKPLHDPNAEGAVVLKTPTKEHIERFNKKYLLTLCHRYMECADEERNLPIIPVVLDPILSRRMRPHQIEGVKFLYESVMGMRRHEGQGCILADEMGLGKTLQTIALIWTLLKQNLYAGVGPIVHKVLIVCPVSLVNNWKSEFHKWLGRDRIGVVSCDKDRKTAITFMNAKSQQVLIIGYERLRTVIDDLSSMYPPIGLIVCDEGHRLKSAQNKTTSMFRALRTPRRIILSGTPIQNDLGEFHAMADFCNPGLLDEYSVFRRIYEMPILMSRAPDATPKEVETGKARVDQLLSIAKSFVLRRDATLLKNYLPPKHEYVLFAAPTPLQLTIFSRILCPERLNDIVQRSMAESLALITLLTKVSNSPILLRATADKVKTASLDSHNSFLETSVREAAKLLPANMAIEDVSISGKLAVLESMLKEIHASTDEKCILVSHYTSTLNILELFCAKNRYPFHRLDGRTPGAQRQEQVDQFNKSSRKSSFIFLLSAKAGGVGLNLTGASRLFLVDSDWNPSHDLQAMARCHRDGQTRPVYVYRLLTTGTIDEKIYQRQVTKVGLSNSVMGSDSSSSKSDSFTRRDLHDIFRIHPETLCNTHDLLCCPCQARGSSDYANNFGDNQDSDGKLDLGVSFMLASQVNAEVIDDKYSKRRKAGLAALSEWKHVNGMDSAAAKTIADDILVHLLRGQKISDDAGVTAETENIPDSFPEQTSAIRIGKRGITFIFERMLASGVQPSEEDDLQNTK